MTSIANQAYRRVGRAALKGGQKGHPWNTLRKVAYPDHIVRLTTATCDCGLALDADSGEVEQTYQVFDLPQPQLEVTELPFIIF